MLCFESLRVVESQSLAALVELLLRSSELLQSVVGCALHEVLQVLVTDLRWIVLWFLNQVLLVQVLMRRETSQ